MGDTEDELTFRIVLNEMEYVELERRAKYNKIFGVDIETTSAEADHFKLFIRGDPDRPLLVGVLGGKVLPCDTLMDVLDNRCVLEIRLKKKKEGLWEQFINEREDSMDMAPEGPKVESSPEWTPDDHAKGHKERGDVAFKAEDFREAVASYSRALRYVEDLELNVRLCSNRSAAYSKLMKFTLALQDAEAAEATGKKLLKLALTDQDAADKANELPMPKVHFRKGIAHRGLAYEELKKHDDEVMHNPRKAADCLKNALTKYEAAIAAFQEGSELDPTNCEWEKEIDRTRSMKKRADARSKPS